MVLVSLKLIETGKVLHGNMPRSTNNVEMQYRRIGTVTSARILAVLFSVGEGARVFMGANGTT